MRPRCPGLVGLYARMPSPESLSAAVPPAAAALRDAGVVLQDDDERKTLALAAHVLQVYREHNQEISKVLCAAGPDANSRVLLVLGWALKTAGVECEGCPLPCITSG